MTEQTSCPAQAFFLAGCAGNLFTLYHPAITQTAISLSHTGAQLTPTVILVPPFAEEMNKSRRMFSLLARNMAMDGVNVLLFDLYGTGDSEGDFVQARWEIWRQDLHCMVEWLHQQGHSSISLLGLRSGALLSLDYLRHYAQSDIASLIFWQPVLRGEMMMTQFLRLRLAATMMETGASKQTTADLRSISNEGQNLEIAGYELAPELLSALDSLVLESMMNETMPAIHWLEVVSTQGKSLTVASLRVLDKLRANGVPIVSDETVVGDMFWTTQETTVAPALVAKTQSILQQDTIKKRIR